MLWHYFPWATTPWNEIMVYWNTFTSWNMRIYNEHKPNSFLVFETEMNCNLHPSGQQKLRQKSFPQWDLNLWPEGNFRFLVLNGWCFYKIKILLDKEKPRYSCSTSWQLLKQDGDFSWTFFLAFRPCSGPKFVVQKKAKEVRLKSAMSNNAENCIKWTFWNSCILAT